MRAATPFSSSVRLLFLRNCFAQLPLSLLGGGVAAEYHMERGHFDDAEQHCKALLDRGAAQAKERAKALLCAPPPHLVLLENPDLCFHLATCCFGAGAISIPATTWSTRCRSAGTCDRGLAGHPMQLS